MKKLTRGIGLLGFFSIALLSCDEDPLTEDATSAKIQFQINTTEVVENTTESAVIIQFSKPASEDAIISLKTENDFANVLNTVPEIENGLINIAIQKGDVSTMLKLKPVDNLSKNGDKVLTLTFHNLPGQYVAGTNQSLSIVVKDDEVTDPKTVANFIAQEATLEETNITGIEYQIHLSEALTSEAVIKIDLSSEKGTYDLHFVTEPAAENNTITLPVSAGQKIVAFKVKPVNNNDITGELNIKFTISQTGSPILKGEILEQTLIIKDEELAGKAKGYELSSGNTIVKRFYEYDAQGRIAKIDWENYTPFLTRGTDTYFYDENNNVVKINKHPFKDIVYHWSNGRIVKSDEVSDGVVVAYTEYEYDEAGNVGGHVTYNRLDNGEYAKGLFTIYLYFNDGNLYKSMTYQESNNPEEPTLLRTRTYDNYIDKTNPFPMTEVVPGVNTQTKLATTYRVEETELDLTYQLVYEYRPDGLPAKRIATATGDTQTAVYHYY